MTITLTSDGRHGAARVDVDIRAGGRLSQFWVHDRPLLIDPDPDRQPASIAWGAYPMAPWAGRVRHGRFDVLGQEYQLGLFDDFSHAIHGTVFARPWTVDEQHPFALEMHCPLAADDAHPGFDAAWPFLGIARQRIELLDGQLRWDLSIEAHDHVTSFPGEIGWHPWFRQPASLSFHPDAMYERDTDGIPTGHLVPPSPGPWDDCFVNTSPVTLRYDDLTLTVSSDCDHWVVYDHLDGATCIEPQSGPPDAFNIRPRLVTPTHPLRRTMNISW